MKWLKNKVIKWVREDWNKAREDCSVGIYSPKEQRHPEGDPILQFRVYSAENGQVLEFQRYDSVKDRSRHTVYIINKDEEVSEKVAKCISLEMLR